MLKTTFIKKVEELGYSVQVREAVGKISIRTNGNGHHVGNELVATLRTNRQYHLNTDYIAFNDISTDDAESLFSVMMEFSATPVEDRAVAEKYVYALDMSQGESRDDMQKLAKIKPGITTWVKETVVQACDIPAYHFTDKEIEAMSEQAKLIISACIKINVADIESEVN